MIGPLPTTQLETFYSVSFTHHILLLNRCKAAEERFFYLENAAKKQLWSVIIMGHQINSDLFKKQGKLPNNFPTTLTESLNPLLDFIEDHELDDERHIELSNI